MVKRKRSNSEGETKKLKSFERYINSIDADVKKELRRIEKNNKVQIGGTMDDLEYIKFNGDPREKIDTYNRIFKGEYDFKNIYSDIKNSDIKNSDIDKFVINPYKEDLIFGYNLDLVDGQDHQADGQDQHGGAKSHSCQIYKQGNNTFMAKTTSIGTIRKNTIINTQNWKSGTYFIHLEDNSVHKIIKL